jgi:hypothetical protein
VRHLLHHRKLCATASRLVRRRHRGWLPVIDYRDCSVGAEAQSGESESNMHRSVLIEKNSPIFIVSTSA